MPLVFKSEPPEIAQTVKDRLKKMTDKQAFRTPRLAKTMLRGAAPTPIPTQAIPVHHLGLKELAEKGDISSATMKSWRYLIKQEEEVVASADAFIGSDNKAVFSHINEGPLVKGVVAGIKAANSNDEITKGQYEVRLIMIPAIYVAALWFVDVAGKRDLAIPIEPVPSTLVANKVIAITELMKTLQKLAKAAITAQKSDATLGG
jgi:hypothetical protein